MPSLSLFYGVFLVTIVAVTSELVWLRDMTFDHDKINLNGGLPDILKFSMTKGKQKFELNLKENRRLHANAPVYDMKINHDGKRELVKKTSKPIQDTRYYQDKGKSGAFSVICVNRADGPCVRQMTGSMRLEDMTYEIKPAPYTIKGRGLDQALRGVPHEIIERDEQPISRSAEKVRASEMYNRENVDAHKLEIKIPEIVDARKLELKVPENKVSGRQNAELELLKEELRELLAEELTQKLRSYDSARRNKRATDLYALEIFVVCDPAVWTVFYEKTSATSNQTQEEATENALRQHFVHIINGVSLRYEEITDPDMNIFCTISGFYFLKVKDSTYPAELDVPVTIVDDKVYADTDADKEDNYLYRVTDWVATLTGLPHNDHVMFFTGYDLINNNDITDNGVVGYAHVGGVCTEDRISVTEDGYDLYIVISIAAHELGHNFGSDHDGHNSTYSLDCSPEDNYLMAPGVANFDETKPYSINPWRFSNCSVKAFKAYVESLGTNNCLLDIGDYYDYGEYQKHTELLPGQLHNPSEQCNLLRGDNSYLCNGANDEAICRFMLCKGDGAFCWYYAAAMGTPCGKTADNKMCFEGLCVPTFDIFTGNTGGGANTGANTATTATSATTVSPTTTTTQATTTTTVSPTTTTTQATTTTPTTTQPPTTTTTTTTTPTTTTSTQPPTTTSTPTTTGSDSCVDTGIPGWTCSEISSYFLASEHDAPDVEWCKWLHNGKTWRESVCCQTCTDAADAAAAAAAASCTGNTGWFYSDIEEPIPCEGGTDIFNIEDAFLDQNAEYPEVWCQDPTWYDRCCEFCFDFIHN